MPGKRRRSRARSVSDPIRGVGKGDSLDERRADQPARDLHPGHERDRRGNPANTRGQNKGAEPDVGESIQTEASAEAPLRCWALVYELAGKRLRLPISGIPPHAFQVRILSESVRGRERIVRLRVLARDQDGGVSASFVGMKIPAEARVRTVELQ